MHPSKRRPVLIVAHGSPSEPALQECALRLLAGQVAHELGGWPTHGVTLAAREAFAQHVARLRAPLVYPFFMSDGWFVSTALPRRLAEAGATEATMLPPFGLDPALPDLLAKAVRDICAREGRDPSRTEVILAAHGSPSDPRPRAAAERVGEELATRAGLAEVRAGYVDEAPGIADVARRHRGAICLPFFALRAGHVLGDLPDALSEAGFQGQLLEPVGIWPQIPALVAAACKRALATSSQAP